MNSLYSHMFLYHSTGLAFRCVVYDGYLARRWLCTSNAGGCPTEHLCSCSRWGPRVGGCQPVEVVGGVLVAVSQTKYQSFAWVRWYKFNWQYSQRLCLCRWSSSGWSDTRYNCVYHYLCNGVTCGRRCGGVREPCGFGYLGYKRWYCH
jgi:hypothetical protein